MKLLEAVRQRARKRQFKRKQRKAMAEMKRQISSLENAEEYLRSAENAKQAYFEKDYPDAIHSCTDAIRFSGGRFPWDYCNRGLAYLKQDRFEEALEDFNSAIARKPDEVRVYAVRGCLLLRLGKNREASLDFSRVIDLAPGYAPAFNNRGYALMSLGEYDSSIPDFSKAIALDPEVALFYNNRGYAYAKTGSYEKALADIRYALKLAPEDADALHSLGFVLMERNQAGDREEALRLFTRAISLDPSMTDAYADRAKLCRAMGDHALAEQDEAKLRELGAGSGTGPGAQQTFAVDMAFSAVPEG